MEHHVAYIDIFMLSDWRSSHPANPKWVSARNNDVKKLREQNGRRKRQKKKIWKISQELERKRKGRKVSEVRLYYVRSLTYKYYLSSCLPLLHTCTLAHLHCVFAAPGTAKKTRSEKAGRETVSHGASLQASASDGVVSTVAAPPVETERETDGHTESKVKICILYDFSINVSV